MSEQEKKTVQELAEAAAKLSENKRERLVGIAEGMALMAAKSETKQEA